MKANALKLKLMTRLLLLAGFLSGFAPVAQAFYNPSAGRWLSRDPIGERGGKNLYNFVGNNCINTIDVLGKHPADECYKQKQECDSECIRNYGDDIDGPGRALACQAGCSRQYQDCASKAVGPFPILKSNCKECNSYNSADEYANSNARCFCKCAGDSDWSQVVRGCLRTLYDAGVSPHVAHQTCYALADHDGYSRPWATLAWCYAKCFDYNPF